MERVWQIWVSGGWVMIPLFILATLLYTQAFGLLMYMRRTRLNPETEPRWRDWVRAPETAQGRVAEIIRFTQSDVSSTRQVRNRFEEIRLAWVAMIDRRAKFLATLVTAAPLLGLLGTVLGMLQTFFGLSTGGGTETAGVVAGGISEALVTTEAGLMIALPGLFIVMLIQRQRHGLDAQLARLESLTLSELRFG
jgi:biopolymer transport protein ExbB